MADTPIGRRTVTIGVAGAPDGVELTVMRRLGDAPDGPALVGGFAGGAQLRLAVVTG